MQTKRGIELDLKESKFIVKVYNMTFYFSSELYMKKFAQTVENYAITENLKFQGKYGVNVEFKKLFAISYYKKLEKRGFRIVEDETKTVISPDINFSVE